MTYLKDPRTCSQRYDAHGRLPTDQFVPDRLQYSQHPSHGPVAPANQHPKPGNLPERVQAGAEKKKKKKKNRNIRYFTSLQVQMFP